MTPDQPAKTHNCRACRHFSLEAEGWEMPWIKWYECAARPGLANLWSFPFKNTKCSSWKKAAR